MSNGNLGNLWYELNLKDNDTSSKLKTITDALKNIGDGKTITIDLAGDADKKMKDLKAQVESLSKSQVNISVDAIANTVEVKNFHVSDEAINNLSSQITAGLAKSAPIQLGNVNVSGLQTAVANAVKNAIDIAKPGIIDKIKQAITSNNSKLNIAIDSAKIAKDISTSLANAGIKLTNVKVDKDPIVKNIESALRSKKFTIDIAINKMEIAAAVDHALKQAGYKNVMSYSASDARIDKAARDAQKAEDAHALAQEKLRKAQLDTAKAAAKNANAHKGLTREVSNTTLATNVLGDAIGNVFSVYAVKNFAQEIIQVGGELEKMRMAMGSIMGDTYKADTIFKQVSDLSMVSPFDVQDLVQYTKQLNAFGIQYSDLYDTTKRLSDIAAATGVSFGRIAYEFGQTSARGWLDGRELRMFANSGIPLLQKLSDYYTKTMGKIVSASQVREMVTKRQVSFEDVRKVLWELTDEGGAFYQMQEVMAESLSAKWVNLANDWNLMLGKIAESGAGNILKRFAELLMKLVENWRIVGGAITPVIGYLGLYNIAQNLANKQALAGAVAQRTFGEAVALSGKYIANASKALLANPTTWFVALASAAYAGYKALEQKAAEAEERAEAVAKKATEGFKNIEEIKASPTFTVEPKNEAEYKQAIKRMTDYVKDYAPDAGGVLGKIFGDKDNEGLKTMKEQYNALKGVLDELSESYKGLIALKDIFNSAEKITDGFFDEGMVKNLKDVGEASSALDESIKEMLSENGIGVAEMLKKVREGSEEFTKAVTDEEGNLRSLSVQLRTLILDFNDLYNANSADIAPNVRVTGIMADWFGMGDVLTNLENSIGKLNNTMEVAYEDIETFIDKYESKVNYLKEYDPIFKKLTGDEQKRAVTMSIVASIQDNVTNPYARELLYNKAVERGLIFKPSEYLTNDKNNPNPGDGDKTKGDPELDKWKERFKVLKEAYAEYKRWYDLYNDSEKAIAKTKENPLFANLDVDPSALWKNLDALSKQIKTNTKKRREFQLQVEGEKVTITYNNDKDSIAKSVSEMKEQLDRETQNWNLYQKLFDATGAKDWAWKMANQAHQVWDDQTTMWAGELSQQMMERTGDVEKSFGFRWDMSEEQAKKYFGEDGDLVELYLATKKRIEQNGIDFWGNFADITKQSQTFSQKIAVLKETRDRELAKASALGLSKEEIDQMVLYYNDQIGKLELDKLKFDLNWENLLGGAESADKSLLKGARDAMKKFKKTPEYQNMNPINQDSVNKAIAEMTKAIESKPGGFFGGVIDATKQLDEAFIELNNALEEYNRVVETGNEVEKELAKQRLNNAQQGVYSGQDQLKKEQKKIVSNVNSVANAAKALGQATDHPLAAVGSALGSIGAMLSGTGEMWTGIIGAIFTLLDAIGDDANKFMGNIFENIGQAIGSMFSAGFESLGIDGVFGIFEKADYKGYDEMKEKLDGLNKVWESILDRKKSYIEMSWGEDAAKAGEEAKKILDQQLKMEREIAKKRADSGASAGSHSLNYRMWEGSYESIYGRNWKDVAEEIRKTYNLGYTQFNSMHDLADLSGETLASIREDYADLWASMDGDFRTHLENIIEYEKKTEDIDEKVRDRITQTSFDSLRNSFVEALMDMEMSSEDFTQNFAKLMMNAMVNNKLLGKEFDKWLDDWWSRMSNAVEAGDLDAQRNLEKEADEKRKSLLEERDRLASSLNYNPSDSSSSSSDVTSGIKNVTEQTADLLASYINAIRADVSVSRSILESLDLSSLNAVASSQLAQLNMIAANTEAIMNSNNEIRDDLREIRTDFSATLNGTKKMYIQ